MYDMNVKINWEHKRCKHALERMWLRGISMKEVRDAVSIGQKHKQKATGLTEAMHRYYSIVYQEYINKELNLHKIYPVTVKVW